MNLYTLTATQQAMQAHLEAAGFDDEVIADTLEGEGEALKEKRLGYLAVIKSKRALAEARARASEEMNELALAEAESANKMESALLASLLATGDSEVVGVQFQARVKGKAAGVVVRAATLIPALYLRTPPPKVPVQVVDKKAIAEALAGGQDVPGCVLGLNKRLEIK